MKKWCSSLLMAVFVTLMLALASGCGGQDRGSSTVSSSAEVQSQQAEAGRKLLEEKAEKQESGKDSSMAGQKKESYTMQDIRKLKHTEIFAKGALEHIFDGTVNKKGKATGYHLPHQLSRQPTRPNPRKAAGGPSSPCRRRTASAATPAPSRCDTVSCSGCGICLPGSREG